MTDNDTIAVAVTYAAMALLGPFFVSMVLRWSESQDAAELVSEIGAVIEEVTR